jgi:C-terminal processing protease CtpA/Prc
MASLQSPLSSSLTGQTLCGVGLSLQCHNSRFYVAEVLPICSGFFEHSIQPGDEIQKVGSLNVRGMSLEQLDRALLGEAGTFVSVLLQRHSQLLETTLLRIEQPHATSLKHMPIPLSPVHDDAEKIAQAIRGFDADNAHLRTTLKSIQSQLAGACSFALTNCKYRALF